MTRTESSRRDIAAACTFFSMSTTSAEGGCLIVHKVATRVDADAFCSGCIPGRSSFCCVHLGHR